VNSSSLESAAWIVIAAAFVIFVALREARLRAQIPDSLTQLAKENDFALYTGELPDVPRELLKPLAFLLRIENAVVGKRFDEEVVAFSYVKGWKRSERVLLAFAVKQKYPQKVIAEGLDRVRRSGDWVLVSRFGIFSTMMTPDEIVQVWNRMRTTPAGTPEFHSEAVVIRPRHEAPRWRY